MRDLYSNIVFDLPYFEESGNKYFGVIKIIFGINEFQIIQSLH